MRGRVQTNPLWQKSMIEKLKLILKTHIRSKYNSCLSPGGEVKDCTKVALQKLLYCSLKFQEFVFSSQSFCTKTFRNVSPLTFALPIFVKQIDLFNIFVLPFSQLPNNYFLHQPSSIQDKPEWNTNPRREAKNSIQEALWKVCTGLL